jgi:hypothetical protein
MSTYNSLFMDLMRLVRDWTCEAITFRRTLVGNFHGLLAYSEMIHRL